MLSQSKIFGLKLNFGKFEETYGISLSSNRIKENTFYCFLNSHMLYEYHKTRVLREVLSAEQAVIFPDGVPVLKSLRWIKGIKSDRIAGNDVMFSLIDIAASEKFKVFLIGGSLELLNLISDQLNKLKVRNETYSPPFAPIEQFDFVGQAKKINNYNPDLILVGLGCPKQELWMYHMKDRVNAPMFGLGGAFALFAGVDTRAPLWMRNLSLEWLYRLSLEPGRLWKRYLVTNSYFIFLFLREFWRVRIRGKQ